VVDGTVVCKELVDGIVVSGARVVEKDAVVSGMDVVVGAVVSGVAVVVRNVFFLSFLLLPPETDSSISSSELGFPGSLSLSVVEDTVVSGACVLVDGTVACAAADVVDGTVVCKELVKSIVDSGAGVDVGDVKVSGKTVFDGTVFTRVTTDSVLVLTNSTTSSLSVFHEGATVVCGKGVVDGTVVSEIVVVEEDAVVSGMNVVVGAVVSGVAVVVSNVFFLSFLLLPPETDSSISSSELGLPGSLSLSVNEGTVVF
jgi:uncharacterized membrane protein YkgB